MVEQLVRVLFLVAPYKRHLVQKMAQGFSSRVVYEFFVPDHAVDAKRSLGEEVYRGLSGARGLRRALLEFEPDIIYSDSHFHAAQMPILSRSKKPVIVHFRGHWWREYSSMLQMLSWPTRFLSIPVNAYVWASFFSARMLTPICKWLEKALRIYLPGKNTQVVYQAVDPQEFYSEEGFEFQKPSVAIIQNHTIYPKVAGLINFAKVVERLPRINFYIAEGEDFTQTFLPAVKARYSTLPNAHFVKGVNSPAGVRKMLTASDCYVLATGLDCCPTTVLEASLMRKPVIASRVGGVPEILLDNETGWAIGNNSTNEWVARISQIVTDSKLNTKMGDKGREWVSNRFEFEVIARQVESLMLNEGG